ncbi:MAG: hypothetical protein ACXAC7_04250 [Candidatus Hodarchaeales archaeon]|jgi:hypothetical protein
MAQKEGITDKEKLSQIQLPWISFLAKPQMNFRTPKIDLPHRAPHQYIAGLLVLTSLFLLAGGIYNITENPLPLGFTQQGYMPIYTSLNDQFLIESLSALVFIGLGAAGFYLMRYPTQQKYGTDMRSATFILVMGIVLLLISLAATVIMLQIKIYRTL